MPLQITNPRHQLRAALSLRTHQHPLLQQIQALNMILIRSPRPFHLLQTLLVKILHEHFRHFQGLAEFGGDDFLRPFLLF